MSTGRVGAVVIGRNEGPRLERSLRSVLASVPLTVYVDSASSDGSAARARALGVEVVELDTAQPLSAARARNRGAERLLEREPTLELIQFVDGDCELVAGWLEHGVAELDRDPTLALVCGRQREGERDASLYHRLLDIEWDAPLGRDQYCAGTALVRVAALRSVGGYRDSLIAGEEPELCVRLLTNRWHLLRTPAPMAIHDAGRMSFARWWRRARRGGFAFAAGAHLHGASPLRHWVRESRSIWLWGLALPLAIVASAAVSAKLCLLLLLAYPALWLVIALRHRRRGMASGDAALYATFCILGKFPEAIGQVAFRVSMPPAVIALPARRSRE